jgi:signal transduction histidine kinase
MVASAGVYAFVALHYGALWWMRRQADEHGAFARLGAALVVFALGAAVVAEADTIAEAAAAQRWQYAVALCAAAVYTSFCLRMGGGRSPRLERSAWIVAAVGSAVSLAGLFVDPSIPSAGWDGSTPAAGGRPIAELLLPARIFLSAAIAISFVALLHLGRAARGDAALRGIFLGACMPFVGACWDLWVRLSSAPLPVISPLAPLGAVLAATWAFVGRFVAVEADLAARTAELGASYERLRHAQAELVRREQLAAVGELSAVIAHEVRNPLAIIRNAVSSLRRSELAPADAETLLGILDDESDRLNRFVEDLLAYARPVTPEPRAVDLSELVERGVELARQGQLHRKSVELAVVREPGIASVDGDPALLRHALVNLVDIAIQSAADGARITITCKAAKLDKRDAIAIELRDDAPGAASASTSGASLGLAIVERVARVHGGRVEIATRADRPTTVTLLLPRERSSLAPPSTFT